MLNSFFFDSYHLASDPDQVTDTLSVSCPIHQILHIMSLLTDLIGQRGHPISYTLVTLYLCVYFIHQILHITSLLTDLIG